MVLLNVLGREVITQRGTLAVGLEGRQGGFHSTNRSELSGMPNFADMSVTVNSRHREVPIITWPP